MACAPPRCAASRSECPPSPRAATALVACFARGECAQRDGRAEACDLVLSERHHTRHSCELSPAGSGSEARGRGCLGGCPGRRRLAAAAASGYLLPALRALYESMMALVRSCRAAGSWSLSRLWSGCQRMSSRRNALWTSSGDAERGMPSTWWGSDRSARGMGLKRRPPAAEDDDDACPAPAPAPAEPAEPLYLVRRASSPRLCWCSDQLSDSRALSRRLSLAVRPLGRNRHSSVIVACAAISLALVSAHSAYEAFCSLCACLLRRMRTGHGRPACGRRWGGKVPAGRPAPVPHFHAVPTAPKHDVRGRAASHPSHEE